MIRWPLMCCIVFDNYTQFNIDASKMSNNKLFKSNFKSNITASSKLQISWWHSPLNKHKSDKGLYSLSGKMILITLTVGRTLDKALPRCLSSLRATQIKPISLDFGISQDLWLTSLKRINLIPGYYSHMQLSVARLHRLAIGMYGYFDPTPYNGCYY